MYIRHSRHTMTNIHNRVDVYVYVYTPSNIHNRVHAQEFNARPVLSEYARYLDTQGVGVQRASLASSATILVSTEHDSGIRSSLENNQSDLEPASADIDTSGGIARQPIEMDGDGDYGVDEQISLDREGTPETDALVVALKDAARLGYEEVVCGVVVVGWVGCGLRWWGVG